MKWYRHEATGRNYCIELRRKQELELILCVIRMEPQNELEACWILAAFWIPEMSWLSC